MHRVTTTTLRFLIAIACLLVAGVAGQQGYADDEAAGSGKLYELRFYVAAPGKLDALNARFRDHTLKLFEKHGMENIAYWTVAEGDKTDGEKAKDLLIYIVAHENEAAKDASWQAFVADPDWKAARDQSETDGKLLAEAPRVIFMTEAEFSKMDWPVSASDSPAKLYELRQYNDGPDRVPFTVERFAAGEDKLFTDAGMETVAFWKANDDSAFIYLLAHQDRDTSKESWGKFFKTFRAFMDNYKATHDGPPASAKPGNGMEVRFLVPTDYSPRK